MQGNGSERGGDAGGIERLARLAQARLYLVSGASPGGRTLEEVLPPAFAGGVDVFQLREKHLAESELIAAARRAAALCRDAGALFVVNDRPDVALAAGADGVHVGQDDMPVAEVRSLVGEGLIVGLSTHARSEIDLACAAIGPPSVQALPDPPAPRGADYIGVGPVHETPTKQGRPAVGTELVAYASMRATLPFFAIGGLDVQTLPAVLDAGARRACVLRAVAEASDPQAAAAALRAAIDAALEAR